MPLDGTGLSTSRTDVSVVVSTYNRHRTLPRVIESLLEQRVPASLRYEIIVVDNNCTDATRDLIADYLRRFPRLVRYAFEGAPGRVEWAQCGRSSRAQPHRRVYRRRQCRTRGRGWRRSRVCSARIPTPLASAGRCSPNGRGHRRAGSTRGIGRPSRSSTTGSARSSRARERPLCLLTANLAIRRDVMLRLGGFSADFPRCQDHELQLRLWRSGGRVLYAPELVTFAPVDPERMTRRYHRQWHEQHGRNAARMRLEEVTDECWTTASDAAA